MLFICVRNVNVIVFIHVILKDGDYAQDIYLHKEYKRQSLAEFG
jgi:hypothetical protein